MTKLEEVRSNQKENWHGCLAEILLKSFLFISHIDHVESISHKGQLAIHT